MVLARCDSGNFPKPGSVSRRVCPSKTAGSSAGTPFADVAAFARHAALALSLLGLPLIPATAAEVFKWKDAAGHLHFGDKPPGSEIKAESVTIRGGEPAAANEHGQARLREVLEGYTRERKAREASRAAAARRAEQREQACERAKARRQRAERTNVMYVKTAKGERRILDGSEHQHVIDKARQAVTDSCD